MKTIYHIILGLFISSTVLAAGSGTISPLPIKYFTGLNDTPNSYSGAAGYVVQVSPTSSALIFTSTSSLGITQDLSGYAKLDTTNQPFTGSLNLSSTTATSSQYRITSGDYSRWVRASSSNLMNLFNRVEVVGGDGTGGTITHSGGYTIHSFTTTGTSTFTPPAGISNVEVLIIAGGGAGGYLGLGGGGGAGGLLSSSSFPVTVGSNTVYVGAGGAPASSTGGYSLINSTVALGGGRGAYENGAVPAVAGGSGGGGVYTAQTGAAGTAGQGYAGGSDAGGNPPYAGGGGGSSGVGPAQVGSTGGNGGPGTSSSITGSAVTYACGGGAGGYAPAGGAAGTAGCASAGNGNAANNGAGAAATANSGSGGGGGAGGGAGSGGAGGSGIVIIRYIPVTAPYETNLVESLNSATGGISGVNTFSDDLADTHLTGSTLSFDIAGVVKAFISALGYFGIGTTTPATALSVVGTTTTTGLSVGSNAIIGNNLTVDTTTLSVDATNNRVGIGRAAPATKLDILGTSASVDATIQIVGNGVSTLFLGQDANGGVIRGQGGQASIVFRSGGSADSAASASGMETMRINSAGFVGIGTTSPIARLSVIGTSSSPTSNLFVLASSSNTQLFTVGPNGSTTISNLGAGFVKSTSAGGLYIDSNPLASYVTYSYASSTFPSFEYASSTFLTITDAGTTYVPYIGATGDLNLGTNNLILDANSSLNFGTLTISYDDAGTLYLNPTDLDGGAFLDLTALTTNQTFTFPDQSGTFALVGDLDPYVTYTYASSTFPSFEYASSTFASTSWVTATYPSFAYGTSTYYESYKSGVTNGPGFSTSTTITHNLGYTPKYIEIESYGRASSTSGREPKSSGFYNVTDNTYGVIFQTGYAVSDPTNATTYAVRVEDGANNNIATGTISNIGTSTFRIDYGFISGSSLFGSVLKWRVR